MNLAKSHLELSKWIWLNSEDYPDFQLSKQKADTPNDSLNYKYCIADFKKIFTANRTVAHAEIDIFADSKFRLTLNGCVIGVGPVNNGGDFITSDSLEKCYFSTYELELKQGDNEIYVEVQLSPIVLTDTSRGRGGLTALCRIEYTDGSNEIFSTDSTWLSRRNTAWESAEKICFNNKADEWKSAEEIKSIWSLLKSPLPTLYEEFVKPCDIFVFDEFKNRVQIQKNKIIISSGCPVTLFAKFPKIFSAYPTFRYSGCESIIRLGYQEFIGKSDKAETLHGSEFSYRGFRLQSIGYISMTISFSGENSCEIYDLGIISTHYPITSQGNFECSDEALNSIYNLGKHTAKICRQSLHLDSPMHQEHLACTGDYFIESLISYYCFGDTRLSRFDIVRTCDMLRHTKGIMFHTSYSLILLQMITDYYKFSGDDSIFFETIDALHLLLKRFFSYTGDDGLIHNPPNYMFVDWIEFDGISMHHPPKALGQTVLNAFYYKALNEMVFICDYIGDNMSDVYKKRSVLLKTSFNETFFDPKKGLYFDGLNTPDNGNGFWSPPNTEKRYFSQHSNTLAVLYDLCDTKNAMPIMEKVMTETSLIQAQPYFMHYVLEAIYKTNLFSKYGLPQIHRWTKLVNECDRGLKEIWSGFDCDYSHAWGATPTYQLPSKLLGLEIIESGFKKITFSPNLYGLDFAKITIPTPFGYIVAELDKKGNNKFVVPNQIEWTIL